MSFHQSNWRTRRVEPSAISRSSADLVEELCKAIPKPTNRQYGRNNRRTAKGTAFHQNWIVMEEAIYWTSERKNGVVTTLESRRNERSDSVILELLYTLRLACMIYYFGLDGTHRRYIGDKVADHPGRSSSEIPTPEEATLVTIFDELLAGAKRGVFCEALFTKADMAFGWYRHCRWLGSHPTDG
jgi:hypothetical protein